VLVLCENIVDRVVGQRELGQGQEGGQVGRVEGRQYRDENPPGGKEQPGRVCNGLKWFSMS